MREGEVGTWRGWLLSCENAKGQYRRGGGGLYRNGGRSRIRTYDFHRVKVIAYQPDEANKRVKRRTRGQKPAQTALFATNLLPN